MHRTAIAFAIFLILGAGPGRGAGPRPNAACLPCDYVLLDIETTGLNPVKDRIVEIAALRIRDGRAAATNAWLVNPGIPVPRSAERIHGISDAMLRDAPALAACYGELRSFVGTDPLLIHNASFDRRFLAAAAVREGLPPLTNEVINTLAFFRLALPAEKSHSLESLTRLYAIPVERRHRALDDCRALFAVISAHATGAKPSRTPPQASTSSPSM